MSDQEDLERLILGMWSMTRDVDKEVDELKKVGDKPLSEPQARQVFMAMLDYFRKKAERESNKVLSEQLPKTPEEEEAWFQDFVKGRRDARTDSGGAD